MNELSIEEKEKTYDKLIKRLNNAREDTGGYTFKSVYDEVMSELKESEDERINKKIEEYTTQGNCPHYDENASVCDDGECGCAECISRIKRCEKNSIKPDKK